MAPRTDRTTRIPSGVTSPVTTNHAAKGSVFVNLRNASNLKIGPTKQMAARDEMEFGITPEVRRYRVTSLIRNRPPP